MKFYYFVFLIALNSALSQHNNTLDKIYSIKIETENNEFQVHSLGTVLPNEAQNASSGSINYC